jgi:hypothetical protein
MSISGFAARPGAKEPQMDMLKKVGPYLAIEILLPGGTLIALLVCLARNRRFLPGFMSILGPAIRLFT